jgi:hypothetical protein
VKELWKPIPKLPYREVSNKGRVRKIMALKKPLFYSYTKDSNGHLIIQIRSNGVPNNLRVSRLVGEAFCEDYNPELRPRFVDGDKTNCHADNLKWVTVSEITCPPYSKNPRPTS